MTKTQKIALLSVGASVLTLALKFGAYFITQSASIFSDAMESFVNLAASLMAFAMLHVVAKPADWNHPYGHDKAEYFSSGLEGAFILMAAVSIAYTSWHHLVNPPTLEHLGAGIFVTLLATLVNFGAAKIMLKVAKEYDSITLEADAKHLLADCWTSIAVVFGLVIILFAPPSWQILDPIIAIAIAGNIFIIGFKLLKGAIDGLMDVALPDTEIELIQTAIMGSLPEHSAFSKLKTRKSGAKRFIDFKLLLPEDISVKNAFILSSQLKKKIHAIYPNTSVTIQIEPLNELKNRPFSDTEDFLIT